jgi:hypothetical protein
MIFVERKSENDDQPWRTTIVPYQPKSLLRKRQQTPMSLNIYTLAIIVAAIMLAKPAGYVRCSSSAVSEDAHAVITGLRYYFETYRSLPKGGDTAVFAALTGNNPKKEPILEWHKDRRGPNGEFLDIWGTMYKVTMDGDGPITVRSAGPDKKFGGSDDEIVSLPL